MDYEKLKEVIAKQIKENGRREITGPVLQAVLMAMVDSLGEVYPQTYTDEQKAQARANIDALSDYDGEITKEKLSIEVQAILNDVANKQDITDASLATIAKTIVGAINEVYKGGLKDASIATSKIEDGAITDAKIASGAVTTPKIANDAVTTEKVNDGAITEPKLDTDLANVITSAVQPAELASAIATALASYVAKADIVDTTGSAPDKVMSQHGVTEAINGVTNKVTELNNEAFISSLLVSEVSTSYTGGNSYDGQWENGVFKNENGGWDLPHLYEHTDKILGGTTKNITFVFVSGLPSASAAYSNIIIYDSQDNIVCHLNIQSVGRLIALPINYKLVVCREKNTSITIKIDVTPTIADIDISALNARITADEKDLLIRTEALSPLNIEYSAGTDYSGQWVGGVWSLKNKSWEYPNLYSHTEMISAASGTNITYILAEISSAVHPDYANLIIYDGLSNNAVSYINVAPGKRIIALPIGFKCIITKEINTSPAIKIGIKPTDLFATIDNIKFQYNPTLMQKKWVSFGDSITAREAWQGDVVSRYNLLHTNCGQGSTCIGIYANDPLANDAMCQAGRLNAIKTKNPDIVTILGGANDNSYQSGSNIGLESNLEDKDTSTFIGAYSYIIDNLLTWKPSLRIIILSPTRDFLTTHVATVKNYVDAARMVADFYGLPFVDLYNRMGLNSLNKTTYLTDNIHPNSAGGKLISGLVFASMDYVML